MTRVVGRSKNALYTPDVLQEPASTDIAYVAGFFDGEGCVYVHSIRKIRSHWKVNITQNDVRPLQYIQSMFGGTIYKNTGSTKRCHTLIWLGERSVLFLERVRPYLIVKAEQADDFIRSYDQSWNRVIKKYPLI